MAKKRSRSKKNRPRRHWGWLIRVGLVVVVLLGCVGLVYGYWASTFDLELVKEMRERSTVFDCDGKVYSRLAGENRLVVPGKDVAPSFKDALLAREDSRFLSHRGIDPIGILRAVVRNVTRGAASQGASTLTQQLARNSFPLGGKTIHRKLLEAFVARRIEQHYSKAEILENYMNRIYFGPGGYGIEAAALSYFGKHASDLSLGEAALIAGIIRAPSYFSPFTNFPGAVRQRDQVLARMVKLGKISEQAAAAAREAPLKVLPKRGALVQENYAMDAVNRELDLVLTDEQQAEGGLKIFTTIDPGLQNVAQAALDNELRKVEQRPGYAHARRSEFSAQSREEELPTPYLQGAVVVIDNRSGAVRALVGGRDFAESKLNRAFMARRQIGSTFKPFVYAAALKAGLLPGTLIDDGPIARGEIRGAGDWTPDNSDGTNKGQLPAEEAVVQSRNTMAVRIGARAGVAGVVATATAAGLPKVPAQPGIFLGTCEATVLDLTAAYTVFPNGGVRRQHYLIERIEDASGETLYRASKVSRPALDPGVAWLTTAAMEKVMERGTAAGVSNLGFSKPAAGKTGTTNDYMDAWFVGSTNSLTCGVWVGLDTPKTIISKGYGATLALPVWAKVMGTAPSGRYPAGALKSPAGLQRCRVCASSGELATEGCERAGRLYSVELPAGLRPGRACHLHPGNSLDERSSKGGSGILRSFKKFFGGG